MNAEGLSGVCPICRYAHIGAGGCTARRVSIVLLEIADCTSLEAIRKAEAVFRRAANEIEQWHDA